MSLVNWKLARRSGLVVLFSLGLVFTIHGVVHDRWWITFLGLFAIGIWHGLLLDEIWRPLRGAPLALANLANKYLKPQYGQDESNDGGGD